MLRQLPRKTRWTTSCAKMQVVRLPQAPETSNTKEWSAWFASLADKTVAILDIDPKVFGGLILKEWIADLYEKCRKKKKASFPTTQRSLMWDAYNFLKEYLTRFVFYFFAAV